MNVWKMTLKPEGKDKTKIFQFCKEESIVGIGWGLDKTPRSTEEAFLMAKEKKEFLENDKIPRNIKTSFTYFVRDMKAGDLVWLHDTHSKATSSSYYLCKLERDNTSVDNDWLYTFNNPNMLFKEMDIAFARKCTWKNIPEDLVPGIAKRILCTSNAVQRLSNITEQTKKYMDYIFTTDFNYLSLQTSVNWDNLLINEQVIFDIMDPDEVEDILLIKLQIEGWILLKSSCYKSNPTFECIIRKKINSAKTITGYVQVKTGTVQLDVNDYRGEYSENDNRVFLFSTAEKPYLNSIPANSNISLILKKEILDFMMNSDNFEYLPKSLKYKLALLSNLKEASALNHPEE